MSSIKSHLARRKIRMILGYDALNATSNSLIVTLNNNAETLLRADLDGISLPAGDTRYVTREGAPQYADKVRSHIKVEYTVYDHSKFNEELVTQIIDLLSAQEVELTWASFDQMSTKASFSCKDLEPSYLRQRPALAFKLVDFSRS